MAILKSRKKINKNNIALEHLLLFKNPLGSRFSFRNNLMDEYTFGVDSTSNIIFNIEKTLVLLKRALNFLFIKKGNKQILFRLV